MFRGTEIKDQRPFFFGSDIENAKKESLVEFTYRGINYRYQIAEISLSEAGNTYFLEDIFEGKNYLNQRKNSSDGFRGFS